LIDEFVTIVFVGFVSKQWIAPSPLPIFCSIPAERISARIRQAAAIADSSLPDSKQSNRKQEPHRVDTHVAIMHVALVQKGSFCCQCFDGRDSEFNCPFSSSDLSGAIAKYQIF
jgi:hypothetical protein